MSTSKHPRGDLGDPLAKRLHTETAVRWIGYALIVYGLFLIAHAAYDQDRGIAAPPLVIRGVTNFAPLPLERLGEHPDLFRGLMSYEWGCSILVFMSGLVIRSLVRKADRSDPFSTSFAGNAALDECERTLDDELRKKHSPLRWG